MISRSLITLALLGVFSACESRPPEKPPESVSAASMASVSADRCPVGALMAEVDPTRLRSDIATMVSFGTRHTLSDTVSTTRGIGAARRWVESEFRRMSQDCGQCLEIATPSDDVRAPRNPEGVPVVNVLAIQKGRRDPGRVIIISGHLDSRVSDVMDATSDAPGANDDASGTAAVIEAARILSRRSFDATLVYAALSGEEQGLLGGKILADYARRRGWKVEAVLNNDIIGNTGGSSGERVDGRVRVFTEGVRSLETQAMADARTSNGGEVDSPSRNLARFIDGVADDCLEAFDVMMIYRRDRFGRGGDQVRMLEAGFPSVRVTEGAENYTRQHQDLRVENGINYGDTLEGVDFPYLARVVSLNVASLAILASAPPPPTEVRIEGAVSPDTVVSWSKVEGATGYRIWRRPTTEAVWTVSVETGPNETSLRLPGVIIDDWFFGVAALGADGLSSPVQFAGPVGAFFPPPTD